MTCTCGVLFRKVARVLCRCFVLRLRDKSVEKLLQIMMFRRFFLNFGRFNRKSYDLFAAVAMMADMHFTSSSRHGGGAGGVVFARFGPRSPAPRVDDACGNVIIYFFPRVMRAYMYSNNTVRGRSASYPAHRSPQDVNDMCTVNRYTISNPPIEIEFSTALNGYNIFYYLRPRRRDEHRARTTICYFVKSHAFCTVASGRVTKSSKNC